MKILFILILTFSSFQVLANSNDFLDFEKEVKIETTNAIVDFFVGIAKDIGDYAKTKYNSIKQSLFGEDCPMNIRCSVIYRRSRR